VVVVRCVLCTASRVGVFGLLFIHRCLPSPVQSSELDRKGMYAKIKDQQNTIKLLREEHSKVKQELTHIRRYHQANTAELHHSLQVLTAKNEKLTNELVVARESEQRSEQSSERLQLKLNKRCHAVLVLKAQLRDLAETVHEQSAFREAAQDMNRRFARSCVQHERLQQSDPNLAGKLTRQSSLISSLERELRHSEEARKRALAAQQLAESRTLELTQQLSVSEQTVDLLRQLSARTQSLAAERLSAVEDKAHTVQMLNAALQVSLLVCLFFATSVGGGALGCGDICVFAW
jgi:hypothetical protein